MLSRQDASARQGTAEHRPLAGPHLGKPVLITGPEGGPRLPYSSAGLCRMYPSPVSRLRTDRVTVFSSA